MKKLSSFLCVLCIGFFVSGCGLKWDNYNPFRKQHSNRNYPKPTIGTDASLRSGFNAHASVGDAYLQSYQCALNAGTFGKCPDYTEEEIEEIKEEDGGGYRDGKWVGENSPDCQECTVESWDEGSQTGTIGPGGCVSFADFSGNINTGSLQSAILY